MRLRMKLICSASACRKVDDESKSGFESVVQAAQDFYSLAYVVSACVGGEAGERWPFLRRSESRKSVSSGRR